MNDKPHLRLTEQTYEKLRLKKHDALEKWSLLEKRGVVALKEFLDDLGVGTPIYISESRVDIKKFENQGLFSTEKVVKEWVGFYAKHSYSISQSGTQHMDVELFNENPLPDYKSYPSLAFNLFCFWYRRVDEPYRVHLMDSHGEPDLISRFGAFGKGKLEYDVMREYRALKSSEQKRI
jgi:hypothetical protein